MAAWLDGHVPANSVHRYLVSDTEADRRARLVSDRISESES